MPQLIAITPEKFATKAWWSHTSYTFATRFNTLPVVMSELAKLVPSMPLGFVRTGESFQLVAITSLQPGTNMFVAPDGNWVGDYIPATVRAYPFHLAKLTDSESLFLCFDESSDLLVDAGQGEAFFDAEGPSPALKAIMSFLSETETSRVLTQRLVDALQTAEVIRPWGLNLLQLEQTEQTEQSEQAEQMEQTEGLYRIDEAALNTLPDETFQFLRKTGALPLAYAQLFSMNQLAMLSKAVEIQARLEEQLQSQALEQVPLVGDKGFGLSGGETLKFS